MPAAAEDDFESLVAREREGLFRFFFWALGDREEALDALQETLIRAFRGFGALREAGSARSWLYVIAANVAKRARTRRARRPRTLGAAAAEDARTALHGAAELPPAAGLEAEETSRRLAAALAALEPDLREPLLLFAVSGMKYREIADALGWPIGTVTTRIHAARERLAAALRRP